MSSYAPQKVTWAPKGQASWSLLGLRELESILGVSQGLHVWSLADFPIVEEAGSPLQKPKGKAKPHTCDKIPSLPALSSSKLE